MEKNHRLFLRNLPTSVTKRDIEERFKNHGTIANIEIKEKANAVGSENKFAFVNITTTERQLNTCFQELKNLVINGCKVHMEIAKESFLARLQREREESKAPPTVKPEEPRAEIKHINIKIPQLPKPAVVAPKRSTKKTFEVDFEVVPKPKIEPKLKPVVVVPEPVVKLSTAEQKKKNESDEKRLKSLMEKKMAFRMKGGLIREALNAVDQKPLGKKIIFSDNLDSLERGSAEIKGQKRLFDDDDDGDDILDNNEFKIRGSTNKKLQNLQSNFGNDKRFTLDDRFVEDENDGEAHDLENSSGLHEERDWQLDILQNVLGKPMRTSGSYETGEKRKKGMIRYDPMRTDHHEAEVPVKTHNPKKTNKAKQVTDENDADMEKLPELSKDTFYNVSDNLANTLKQDEQFSLLKTFGTDNEISSIDNPVQGEVRVKQGHQFNFSTKDPFKYDSSDNENQDEDKIADVQKSESKIDWNDSLFFNTDDIRFEDARKFFNKQSGATTEFSTLRRELKLIVRSKIQNNLRKKVTWKKRKLNKT